MRRLFCFLLGGCLPLLAAAWVVGQAPVALPPPVAPAAGPPAAPGAGALVAPAAQPPATVVVAGPNNTVVRVPVSYAPQSSETAEAMRQFSDLEAKSRELAMQIRKLESDESDAAKTQRDELRQQLEKTVLAAFEARQKVQQIEVDQLKKRLAGVEETLQKRQSKKDQIIESRIDELLDENQELRWDPAAPGYGVPATATRQPGPALYPTPAYPVPAPTSPPQPKTPKSATPGAPPGAAAAPLPNLPGVPAGDGRVVMERQLNSNLAETHKALIDTEFAVQQARREVERLKELAQTERAPDLNSLRTAEENLGLAQRHADRVRREYETQTRLLELQVNAARARLTEAQRDHERVNSLGQSGAVSKEEIEKRQSALDVAKAELEYVMTLFDLHRRAMESEQPKTDVKR